MYISEHGLEHSYNGALAKNVSPTYCHQHVVCTSYRNDGGQFKPSCIEQLAILDLSTLFPASCYQHVQIHLKHKRIRNVAAWNDMLHQ